MTQGWGSMLFATTKPFTVFDKLDGFIHAQKLSINDLQCILSNESDMIVLAQNRRAFMPGATNNKRP